MAITSRRAAVGATALLASTMWAVPANAAPATSAVEFCQQMDEEGLLEADGVTIEECVNIFRGPSSANANNVIARICGFAVALEFTGTTSKGYCTKVAETFFA